MPSQGAEKITEGRDSPVVRNILLSFIKVTSPGAGSSGRSVDWKKVILTNHHRTLAIPADLWTKVIYNM